MWSGSSGVTRPSLTRAAGDPRRFSVRKCRMIENSSKRVITTRVSAGTSRCVSPLIPEGAVTTASRRVPKSRVFHSRVSSIAIALELAPEGCVNGRLCSRPLGPEALVDAAALADACAHDSLCLFTRSTSLVILLLVVAVRRRQAQTIPSFQPISCDRLLC